MNQVQLEAMRMALGLGLQRLDAVSVNCRSCSAWKVSRCTKFDQVPPTDVQQVGCDDWNWDEVPF